MTDEQPMTRRTVLTACGGLVSGGLGTGAVSATTADETTTERESDTNDENPLTGVYSGTIDRIVDGKHVVVLLESDGKTVGQTVVDRDRMPDGEEGNSVTVLMIDGKAVWIWVD